MDWRSEVKESLKDKVVEKEASEEVEEKPLSEEEETALEAVEDVTNIPKGKEKHFGIQ